MFIYIYIVEYKLLKFNHRLKCFGLGDCKMFLLTSGWRKERNVPQMMKMECAAMQMVISSYIAAWGGVIMARFCGTKIVSHLN